MFILFCFKYFHFGNDSVVCIVRKQKTHEKRHSFLTIVQQEPRKNDPITKFTVRKITIPGITYKMKRNFRGSKRIEEQKR